MKLPVTVTFAIALCAKFQTILSAPDIQLPIAAQIPPVARVGQPFQFTFSAATFSSTSGALGYSIQNAPSWLQLDSASRTFTGTPAPGDVGSKSFDLSASDETGSTSAPVTLLVSTDEGPKVGNPAREQLKSFGKFEAPDALLLYPSSPISVSFGQETFTNTNQNTVYYATCANNTPLPSWINFNTQSLVFSGRTPDVSSPLQLPQDFGIRLVATDMPGFSEAETTFRLIIERHEMTFGDDVMTMNAIPGKAVTFQGLKILTIDGTPAKAGDVKLSSDGMPSWLSLDQQSFVISGTTPADVKDSAFVVTASDPTNNSASTTITIVANSTRESLLKPIGPLLATAGQNFLYTIDRDNVLGNNVGITMDLRNCSSWLSFDTKSLMLAGRVPIDLPAQQDELVLTASSGSISESQNVVLSIAQAGGPTETGLATSAPTHDSPAGPLPTTQMSKEDNSGTTEKLRIAAAVLIPTLVVAATILFLLCLRRRRKSPSRCRRSDSEAAGPCLICIRKLKLDKHWISKPLVHQDSHAAWHDNEKLLRPVQKEYGPAPCIPDISGSTCPTNTSRTRTAHSQRPCTQRSSFHESFINEISKRVSWFKKDNSPKPQFSIAEENSLSRNHRESASRPSTPKSKLAALHQARALRLRKNAHGSRSILFNPHPPSGLGHGRLQSYASRSSAHLLGAARHSYSHSGVGHGRDFPYRISQIPLTERKEPPGRRNLSLLTRDQSARTWITTVSSTTSSDATASSNPENSKSANPFFLQGKNTIRRVTPDSSPPPISARRRRPLSRNSQISQILRARRTCDSAYFASSVSSKHKHACYPPAPTTDRGPEPELPVATQFTTPLGTQEAEAQPLNERSPNVSNFRLRPTPSWKAEGVLQSQPSASSLYSQSVHESRRPLSQRSQRHRPWVRGWGSPPSLPVSAAKPRVQGRLPQFESTSSIGGDTSAGSECTEGVGLGIELVEQAEDVRGAGEGGSRERRWAEGKRRSGLIGPGLWEDAGGEGQGKRGERGDSAVLREGGRRPISVMKLDEGLEGEERPEKSLKGSMAFL
ncbi:MAG: hypothetical protein MMC23_009293 [Stictis urceolatum]|nr:hypothetical protein [Stictis urceolata]